MTTPTTAHDFPSGYGTAWSLEKAMADVSPRCPDETSSMDFAELHDDFQLAPSMQEIKQTIIEHGTPTMFDDRYMSSEEQLSPTEHDSESEDLDYDYDEDSVLEIGIAAPLRFTVCDMAVAICVVAAGQPKIVDVSTPMQKPSPSTGRGIGFGRASWMPRRSNATSRPRFSARNADRPLLPTLYSAPTMDDTHSTTAATASTTNSTAPSTASDNSPILSSSLATPPTSAYTDSEGHGSPVSSLCNTFSINSNSPKKEFSVDRSNTRHSFLEHDPYEHTSPPVHRKHSRFRNLSQKIKLPRFGRSSNTSSDDEMPKAGEKDSFESARPVSLVYPHDSYARRKMVARGAAEREPIIQIPDCPYDLDDDGSLIMDTRLKKRKSFSF